MHFWALLGIHRPCLIISLVGWLFLVARAALTIERLPTVLYNFTLDSDVLSTAESQPIRRRGLSSCLATNICERTANCRRQTLSGLTISAGSGRGGGAWGGLGVIEGRQ